MAIQRDKVIANAEKLVAKGKIDAAIKEYERLLDESPNDVNTLNRIGDLWVRINRNDEAVKVFTKIADHYSKDGFFLKAIAIYKKINKLDPSKLEVYAKLADLYAKQGLAMEAKSQYQVLADYYLKHGDPANALSIYRKISELDPNSINVHVKLADLYSQNNQTAEALKEYDRVGRMLLKRGMLDEAVQVFRKALKIDARNVELVESLVTALLEAKDYENALQIVDTALESNRDNPKLVGIWGRIQIARGDVNSARTALERAAQANPDEPAIRETLADIYLKQNNADGALQMLTPLVEKALSRGERGGAVEMLNRVLRVDSGHTPTLERLVAVYSRLNEETNILASMNSLAEAHVAKGRYDEAAKVLEKLIQREPQNAQHRNKLQFVKSQMGGIDTLPVKPKTAADVPLPPMTTAPTPSLEIEEPEPEFAIDETPEPAGFELGLDASEPIELSLELDEPPPVIAPPPPPPPPQSRLASAVEMAAADISEGDEDLDFITEHLTEAEVFAKYGLAEKAAEHLRTVLERAPKNLAAHERLYKILLDEGDVDNARVAAQAYVSVLEDRGDDDAITTVKNEFTSRGQSFDVAAAPSPVRMPTMERPAPPPPPPAIEQEVEISLDDFGTAEPEEELTFDVGGGSEEGETLTFSDEIGTLIDQTETVGSPEEPFFGVEAVADHDLLGGEPSVEEIGEIDFYIGQELFDEARDKVDALLARYPGNVDLESRKLRIERAAQAAAPAPAPPPPAAPPPPPPQAARPLAISRDEIESELLSAIPDDDEEIAAPPPPAAAPMQPPMQFEMPQEENLFADEDDFFDLASELESELGEEEEQVALGEEEQSLEEIFKEFKKGVEQQLDSEDYDTHYNLGIAYKEMGLIDEAIGEFQLASKDPKRAVECASMLGLCFLEKGMPQLAIKWYRKGLEIAEITEEEHVGLLYDLGSAYMEVGDTANAQKAFMEVYGMNTNYRDIVSRIKQLEGAH
jgi:tetratricopeptide (TPR) repeat protein